MAVPQVFAGRSVLVTGGASGIGLAVAARLVAVGAATTVADVDEAALAAADSQLSGAARCVRLDVRDREAFAGAVADVEPALFLGEAFGFAERGVVIGAGGVADGLAL